MKYVNEYVIYVYEDGSAISIDDIDEMNDKELDSLIHIAMSEKKYRCAKKDARGA